MRERDEIQKPTPPWEPNPFATAACILLFFPVLFSIVFGAMWIWNWIF